MVMVAAMLLVGESGAFAAPKPSVALSPTSGPPGTQVTVTGRGWPVGHVIGIAFPDRGFWGPGQTTVQPDGSFTFSFAWPSPASAGDHQVAAIDETGPVDTPPYPIFTVTSGTAGPMPTVAVGNAYVADSTWAATTRVKPGDLVRYQIVLHVSAPTKVNVRMQVTGPGGRAIHDSNSDVPVDARTGSAFSESRIPVDALAGSYTLTATVTYNGVSTVRSGTFSVDGNSSGTPGAVQVRMPFSGRFANADLVDTTPGTHPVYWPGMQWSTDIYAVPGTPVRLNVSGSGSISMKVIAADEIPGCAVSAGSYVTVSVSINGAVVGLVHYQHLDKVTVKTGNAVTNGAVLGVTHMWGKSACWQVLNDAGVHAHFELGSTSGKSCYVAYSRGTQLGESDTIGGLRVGGYPRLECPKNL